ncbi:MAG TPA: hypothetical protein PLK12_10480 [Prolixibacteraceae bacterium]|nr:hypothetical protein [Prolixibacteraceae bacterium]
MKKILFLLIVCLPVIVHAQDKIFLKKGSSLDCTITSEDSLKTYINTEIKGRVVSTFVMNTDIDSIQYQPKYPKMDVGELSLVDGIIQDKEGKEYILSKELANPELQRSIFSLHTIPEAQIQDVIDQITSKQKSAVVMQYVANAFAYVSGALAGEGLYELIAGDEDLGLTFLAMGGVGILGTFAIFIPIQMGIQKSSVNVLEEGILKPHNQSISGTGAVSYFQPECLKVGLGFQNAAGTVTPSFKVVYTF